MLHVFYINRVKLVARTPAATVIVTEEQPSSMDQCTCSVTLHRSDLQ
jgi:hypothetical protein